MYLLTFSMELESLLKSGVLHAITRNYSNNCSTVTSYMYSVEFIA